MHVFTMFNQKMHKTNNLKKYNIESSKKKMGIMLVKYGSACIHSSCLFHSFCAFNIALAMDTFRTPVWREVERVTLCNACGIRWRRTGLACSHCKVRPSLDTKQTSVDPTKLLIPVDSSYRSKRNSYPTTLSLLIPISPPPLTVYSPGASNKAAPLCSLWQVGKIYSKYS